MNTRHLARSVLTAVWLLGSSQMRVAAAAAQVEEPAGTMRGQVADTTGGMVPGAELELAHQSALALRTSSDERGSYRFHAVPPGRYELTVRLSGFRTRTVAVNVRTGAESVVDVTLEPAGTAEEVTVTATRVETPVSSMPNTVTILDADLVRGRTALSDDLPSLLESSVPGYGQSLKKLTGRGESLRGRNPLYTVNGVPQHTPLRDGERDGHTIDLDFVERVEVIHGSNAIQGIGATGGVVNLVTKSPRSDGSWTHDVKLSTSAYDGLDDRALSGKASYLVGKRLGSFDFVAGASMQKRGLFMDAHGDPVGLYPTQGDIMDSTSRDLYLKAGVDVGNQRRFEVSVNDFRLARDGDFVAVPGNRAENRLTGTAEGDPRPVVGDPAENDVTIASLEYRDRDLAGGEAVVQAYVYDYWALFEGGTFPTFALTPGGPAFLDQSAITSDKLGVKLTYAFPTGRLAGFTPMAGLDFSQDKSAQVLARTGRVWVPETVLREAAPFVQVQRLLLDRVLLSGGLRAEIAELRVGDFTTLPSARSTFVTGGTPSFQDVLPNAGAVYHLRPGVSVYGSYAQGFTMPDVGRVLRAVNVPGRDVDTLVEVEPVVTGNLELGLESRLARHRFHAAWYRSSSDRGSILDPTPEGIFNVRREATEIEGVDLVGEATIRNGWHLGGTFGWLRGQYDTNGDGVPDTSLDGTNIGPNRLNVYLQGSAGKRLSGRLQVSKLLDREFRGLAARAGRNFSGYTLADLALAFEIRGGVIRFNVENLFDKQYVTYFSQTEAFAGNDTFFAGPGRGFTVAFEGRF